MCIFVFQTGLFEGFQGRKRFYLPFGRIVMLQINGTELNAGNLYGTGLQGNDGLFVLGNLHLGKAQADDAQDTGCSNAEVDTVLAAKGPPVCYADNNLASVIDVLYSEASAKGKRAMSAGQAVAVEAFAVGSKPSVSIVPRSFSGEDFR